MTKNVKNINNLFFVGEDVAAQDNGTCILCDPTSSSLKRMQNATTQNKFELQVVILTHLSESNLHLLYSLPQGITLYMSQELFLLLQKMQRFSLIAPIPDMGKIIPYNFPQQIGSFKVTAYKNDDSLYGSLALTIGQKSTTIGYANAFDLYGGHKKRTKKWIKKMATANLTTFITSNAMSGKRSPQLPTNENGIQKNFTKQLKSSKDEPFKVLLSPWNPERLHRFNETCSELDKKLVLPAAIASLLKFFFPTDNVYCYISEKSSTKKSSASELTRVTWKQIQDKVSDFVLYNDKQPNFIDPSIRVKKPIENHSWLSDCNFGHTITPLSDSDMTTLKSRLNITEFVYCESF